MPKRTHIDDQLDVLAAVEAATRKAGRSARAGADVFEVANALGTINPKLLGARRERLVGELRGLGYIALRHEGLRVLWSLTPTGAVAAAMHKAQDPVED